MSAALMIGQHFSILADHFEFESENWSIGKHGERQLPIVQTRDAQSGSIIASVTHDAGDGFEAPSPIRTCCATVMPSPARGPARGEGKCGTSRALDFRWLR
jgi:hypothetical protein